jgi:hypothetical protein
VNHYNLITWGVTESAPICQTCARQSEGECFLCCKQHRFTDHSFSLRLPLRVTCTSISWSTSLFHSRMQTVLFGNTIAPPPLSQGFYGTRTKHSREDREVVVATFPGHPDHPISHPWPFHFGNSWNIICTYHSCQLTFKNIMTGMLTL